MSADPGRWRRLLERIGAQPGALHADHLAHLQRQMLLHVPFENLDLHLGRPIRLDRDALFGKIVDGQRGGFCYELNEAFTQCLLALGFDADRLAARVLLGGGGHDRDHQCSLVRLDGRRWLVDVGFGDHCLIPLNIDDEAPQSDGRGRYRVTHREGRVEVCREKEGAWAPQVSVGLEPVAWSDFDERCAWTQRSPDSVFVGKRVCTRATPSGRVSLTGNHLKIVDDGTTTESAVEENQYVDVLQRHFGVRLIDPVWRRPLELSA